jgi:hypothetical protein
MRFHPRMAIKIETRTKTAIIREHMKRGDWRAAISQASKLPRLDEHRNAILDAQGAYTNERFYRQIGKDPDALIDAGRAALVARFGFGEQFGV